MWLFEWWPYAIAHRLNLFITHLVWAPAGFNLASMTSIPVLALIAYPLTRTVGLVPAYNAIALMAPVSAALCAFALCRYLTRRFWPSILGGYVFGFSAYMLGQLLGHLCLAMVFAIPLMALLGAARLNGDLGRLWFVILLALTLAVQFLVDMEVFATAIVFGAIALAAMIYYSPPAGRNVYRREIPLLLGSICLAALILSPYLYYYFAFPQLRQPFWPTERFSADLINFFVPTPANLLGDNGLMRSISKRFAAGIMESGAYVPIAIVPIVVSWARANWNDPRSKALLAALIVAVVASLGPWLHVGGSPIVIMPWIAMVRLPLFEHMLPARLPVFIFLALSVIAALWLSDPRFARGTKSAAAGAIVLLMLPNPGAGFWTTALEAPAFFANGDCHRYLQPQDVVLTLPWGERGSSMLWQAECGMCFRNVGGWTGTHRFAIRRWPIVGYFLGAQDLPDPGLQLKAFIASTGVSALVVDDNGLGAQRWNSLLESLDFPRVRVSGVSLYRIAPGLLDQYRSMTGVEMERRANRARFEILLRAADRYIESGNDPRQLSVNKLADLSLLPADWRAESGITANLLAAAVDNDHFSLAEYGSYSGMEGLISEYRGRASAIYYPFPHLLWEPRTPPWPIRAVRAILIPPAAGPVDGESMSFLAVTFTRAQLHAGAAATAVPVAQLGLDGGR